MATPAFTLNFFRDINPLPPIGLGYLASIIEEMDIEVRILDCLLRGWDNYETVDNNIIRVGLSDNDIKEYLIDYNPDMVGINCQFTKQYKIYHHIFSLIKEINPNIITVGGGAHVTVCPEEVLNDSSCDFIIIGEGEDSLKELILTLNRDEDISSIDGLGWKKNGKIIINEKQKWIKDLDSIPFPAYQLMELEKYFGLKTSHGLRHKERFSPIVTSRGCPAKCNFCTARKVWGEKYRIRSVGNVIQEMKLLRKQYNVEEIIFEDDNVTANPKRAKQLFSSMIKEGFNYIWDTPNGVGVWSIDEQIIDLMKQSGCINLNFPIESGSQHVIDNIINKPVNLTKVKQLVEHCKKINLDYSFFLVIGMPGEKIKDMWKSFHFVANCGCYDPHISVATPYPGSKLFSECLEYGLFSKEVKLDDFFIRSFMIKTEDWDEYELRKTLLKGELYLKLLMALKNPRRFFRKFLHKINEKEVIGYIKKVVFAYWPPNYPYN